MLPTESAYWQFLPLGYVVTVLIETPVLLLGLSRRHRPRDRLIAGLWLTACTYPIVVLVLPPLVEQPLGRTWYLLVAETFAPLAECLLLRLAYGQAETRAAQLRDDAAVVAANLASFLLGEAILRLIGAAS